jgi:hypothetical protein
MVYDTRARIVVNRIVDAVTDAGARNGRIIGYLDPRLTNLSHKRYVHRGPKAILERSTRHNMVHGSETRAELDPHHNWDC